jgi:hypothetical protein
VRPVLLHVHDVDERLVDGLDLPAPGVDPHRLCAVDADDLDPVSRLDGVDQVLTREHGHGVRRLAFRNIVRRLLDFDHLLVDKGRAVVDQLHRELCLTGAVRAL